MARTIENRGRYLQTLFTQTRPFAQSPHGSVLAQPSLMMPQSICGRHVLDMVHLPGGGTHMFPLAHLAPFEQLPLQVTEPLQPLGMSPH